MISWSYLLEVSFCWTLFYAFYSFWLRKETHFKFNRLYLLSTLIAGLVLPFLQFPEAVDVSTPGFIGGYYSEILSGVDIMETSVLEQGGSFSFLMAIYWTGLMTSLIIFLAGLCRIAFYLHHAGMERSAGFILVRTNRDHAPFSFFNLLFLSADSGLDPEEEDQVIRHEVAHISGLHSFDVLRIIFWFHPFVYLYQYAIRNTHEFMADAAVLKTTPKARYGRLLLEQSLSGPHLVNHFNKSQLKKRLIMMTRTKSSRLALIKYFLAFPIIALCLFLFSCGEIEGQETADNVKTVKVDEKVKKTSDPEVDQLPRFAGCEDMEGDEKAKEQCAQKKMFEFIGTNLKYPATARKNGVEGMVVISFVVDENGAIKKTAIAKSLEESCDKEAMRVVTSMPNWTPGMDDGKAVPVEMKLPFRFKL